jgi:predicted MFS family arabinose efflux permease
LTARIGRDSDHLRPSRLPRSVALLAAVWMLTSAADNYLLLVIVWVAGPEGWSPSELALVLLVVRLPTLLGGLVGGRVIDRRGPVPMMRLALLVGAAAMAGLALTSWSRPVPLGAVMGFGALESALMTMTYTGTRVLVPTLVGETDLPRANALLSLGDQLPAVLAAAAAGPALTVLGPGRGFVLPAGALLMSLVLAGVPLAGAARSTRSVAARPERSRPTDRTEGEDGGRGLSAVPSRTWLLLALSVAYYLCYSPLEPAVPSLVRVQMHAGPLTYGVLWTVFGVGATAGLLVAPRLSRRRPGVVNACGALLWGLVTLPLSLLDRAGPAIGLLLVSGAIWGPYTTVETTALQRWTPRSLHGRIFGLQRALLSSAAPIGAAAGALMLARLSAPAVIAISTVTCTLAGVVALASRQLRAAV